MKLSRILAIVLAGLAFSTTANAAGVDYFDLGTVSASSPITVLNVGNNTYSTYLSSGTLGNNTALVFNYSAGPVVSGNLIASGSDLDNGFTATSNAKFGPTSTSILPILTNASISHFNANGTVEIDNTSGAPLDFSAYFTVPKLAKTSFGTLYVFATAIPLPPALVLFLSGLVAFAGFSVFRKNRGQI